MKHKLTENQCLEESILTLYSNAEYYFEVFSKLGIKDFVINHMKITYNGKCICYYNSIEKLFFRINKEACKVKKEKDLTYTDEELNKEYKHIVEILYVFNLVMKRHKKFKYTEVAGNSGPFMAFYVIVSKQASKINDVIKTIIERANQEGKNE